MRFLLSPLTLGSIFLAAKLVGERVGAGHGVVAGQGRAQVGQIVDRARILKSRAEHDRAAFQQQAGNQVAGQRQRPAGQPGGPGPGDGGEGNPL